MSLGSGVNRKLHTYKFEIDKIMLDYQNIVEMARIGAYFDDSIEFKRKEDIASKSIEEDAIVVNYNMNPYEKTNTRRPCFISLVFKYVDKLVIIPRLGFHQSAP